VGEPTTETRPAYIILAHKNAGQVVRLVQRLNDGDCAFAVHVDRRSPTSTYRGIEQGLRGLHNVYILPRRKCYWGDFSVVEAALDGLRALLARKIAFDHATLLSGQDYPIKGNEEIARFFGTHVRTSFMSYCEIPCPGWGREGGLERVRNFYARFGRHRIAIPVRRRFPEGFSAFGRSAWWSLSRESADYVLSFLEMNRPFVRFFRHVGVPDELFFQTVLVNSPLRETIENENLRFVDWSPGPAHGHPKILTTGDLEALVESPKLFARKFDVEEDAAVLDALDEHAAGTSPV
jgi:hypothetical protein